MKRWPRITGSASALLGAFLLIGCGGSDRGGLGTAGSIGLAGTPQYGIFIDTTIDLVSCTDCAVGTGYAAFRMANNNGLIDGGYATVNIVAKSVVARGGGRGVFSVSGSGAARIDRVDIEGTENNSILLENAHNVTVGDSSQPSRVANSGQLRIAGTSSDIKLQNIAVSGTTVSESPCATNSTWTAVNGAPTNCN